MKRSLCAVVMALVGFAPHASGDSIPTFAITQVTISVGINNGSPRQCILHPVWAKAPAFQAMAGLLVSPIVPVTLSRRGARRL